MLAIESMGYPILFIDRIKDLVSVIFDCGCEDDNFEVLAHLLEKLMAVGSDEQRTVFVRVLIAMNKCLVHV
jgi:hypothetical protein